MDCGTSEGRVAAQADYSEQVAQGGYNEQAVAHGLYIEPVVAQGHNLARAVPQGGYIKTTGMFWTC